MNPAIQERCSRKARGGRIAMLTAYDYPMARLLEESGVDILLVGDSVGMVVLGYPDTTMVTMDEMLHHVRAVARGATHTPILADLPIASYETAEQAVVNGRRLMDAGAHAVKLEGGQSMAGQVAALAEAGVPVMAHIGMMPQHVREEGGYKIKGKTEEEAARLLQDAKAVEEAGAWGVLMELVKPDVARQITAAISIPTIGIGSGPDCDGQVLVTHDLVGAFPWFTPRFVKPKAAIAASFREAAEAYVREVKSAASEPA
jgi:3-methyl-2-oxobutanoate hydroxymethyltransferase